MKNNNFYIFDIITGIRIYKGEQGRYALQFITPYSCCAKLENQKATETQSIVQKLTKSENQLSTQLHKVPTTWHGTRRISPHEHDWVPLRPTVHTLL